MATIRAHLLLPGKGNDDMHGFHCHFYWCFGQAEKTFTIPPCLESAKLMTDDLLR